MPYKHARLFVKSVFFSDFSYHKMFYEFLSCAAKIDFITFNDASERQNFNQNVKKCCFSI